MYGILSGIANGVILAVLLTTAVWLALRLIPRRNLNAATRYVIWWITLAAVILIPISLAPYPRAPYPRAPLPHSGQRHAVREYASVTRVLPALPAISPAHPHVYPPSRTPIAIPINVSHREWPRWPLLLWPLISFALLARLAASLVMLSRLKARAHRAPDRLFPKIEQWLRHCGGARTGIRLAVSTEIATPIATGPHHPTILIPARLFDELSEDDLDRIGLHETAHLVRRDDYALIVQRILEALFIAYPLILWIARHIDLEREIACDDLVIAATGRPRSYADCLTRVVESIEGIGSPWPAATAAEDLSQLARRVDALLDKTRRAGAHLMKVRLAAMTALLLALAFMAARAPALIAFVTTVAAAPYRAVQHANFSPLAAQTQTAPTDDLAGLVMEDNSGNPVASAELRFHKPGLRELAADLETDRRGRFSAAGLPPGEYSIDVSKPNYVATSFHLSVPFTSLTVRLVRYGVIDGQATDTAGNPLPGIIRAPTGRTVGSARVTILTKDPAGGQLSTFREAVLDEAGHYRVFDLPPGQYAVGFWYSGQDQGSGVQLYPDNSSPRFFSVSGGEEYTGVNFVVVPRPASQISGTVQAPPGATGQFQLALGLPEQPALAIAQTLSEKDGTFRFEKIPPGNYDLFVAGPVGGYGMFNSVLGKGDAWFGRTRVQVSGQNVDGLNVPVSAAKTLHVMLRAPNSGAAPAGCPASATVTLASLEPWAIMNFPAAQASFGKEQTIPNLPPGKFRVTATELGDGCFQTNDAIADMALDAPPAVAIELAPAGSIHGILRGSSPGSTVILTDSQAADGAQTRVAWPDAAGRFTFSGLPPARYRVAAFPAGLKPRKKSAGQEIEVAGGKATEIEIKLAEVNP